MVIISYDEENGAIYIELNKNKIHHTINLNEKFGGEGICKAEEIMIDVDEDGKAVGVEILT